MQTIFILGAGDLGATLARLLAEHQRALRVVLVDAEEGKAKGKALDILQSGPVEGFDCRVEGAGGWKGLDPPDAVVVADPADLADRTLASGRAAAFVKPLLPVAARGVLLFAGPHAPALVGAAVAAGFPRERVMGSAAVALCAALRRRLAEELDVEPREVTATVLGLPPDHLVLPQGAALLGGVPVDRIAPTATRRALAALRGRVPGPVALAAGAARVLAALDRSRSSVLPLMVRLEGEYGHRGPVLAVPARLAAGRVQSVVEFVLDPVDRVALDTAAQRSVGQTR